MRELRLYHWLSRFGLLTYRTKILLVVFVGIHLPLFALVSYLVVDARTQWQSVFVPVGVTLAATLFGTIIALWVLHQLLRPVVLTSHALRVYRQHRQKTALPSHYTDEVGVLMADAGATINYLEKARDVLEYTDESTGLANRKKLLQLMSRQANLGLSFYVAIVRLANFSRITEALNLAQAEAAARAIAGRLEKQVEPGCFLARINQSDCALLYAQPADSGRLSGKTLEDLRALIERCAQDLVLRTTEVKPDLLCGVAQFPDHIRNANTETLLDHAIAAVSQATSSTPVIPYSLKARQAALDRLNMEQALRQALEQEQFCLYYQPVINVTDRSIIGAEALIRWHHPQQGLIPLCDFIPIAENSGLIESIDVWVIRRACAQLCEWNVVGLQEQDMRLAINVSARQFRNLDLYPLVEQAIGEADIKAEQIELELTETSAMLDLDHTQRMFALLRDLGVSITIDDFGTGYGSLSYLLKLPFDKLKIDRQFVKDVHQERQSQAICKSLIALAKGFDLDVVSEGTEKEEEVNYLNRIGCHFFQGYFFAAPLTPEAFAEFFKTGAVFSSKLDDPPHPMSGISA